MSESVIAVIPAAGWARRLGDAVTGSKEVSDIGGSPVAAHVLRRLAISGVERAVILVREGKWDVPEALLDVPDLDVRLAFVVISETPSELHTVASGLVHTGQSLVALAYPDVLFEPKDAFGELLERQTQTGADLVLGLFPTESPERVDMVALDGRSRPVEVVIKQPGRGLEFSWAIAVWTPRFSEYLLDRVPVVASAKGTAGSKREPEASVGDVVQRALEDGLDVEAVIFRDGAYVDIGTPEDLERARNQTQESRAFDSA